MPGLIWEYKKYRNLLDNRKVSGVTAVEPRGVMVLEAVEMAQENDQS